MYHKSALSELGVTGKGKGIQGREEQVVWLTEQQKEFLVSSNRWKEGAPLYRDGQSSRGRKKRFWSKTAILVLHCSEETPRLEQLLERKRFDWHLSIVSKGLAHYQHGGEGGDIYIQIYRQQEEQMSLGLVWAPRPLSVTHFLQYAHIS